MEMYRYLCIAYALPLLCSPTGIGFYDAWFCGLQKANYIYFLRAYGLAFGNHSRNISFFLLGKSSVPGCQAMFHLSSRSWRYFIYFFDSGGFNRCILLFCRFFRFGLARSASGLFVFLCQLSDSDFPGYAVYAGQLFAAFYSYPLPSSSVFSLASDSSCQKITPGKTRCFSTCFLFTRRAFGLCVGHAFYGISDKYLKR